MSDSLIDFAYIFSPFAFKVFESSVYIKNVNCSLNNLFFDS